MRTGTQMSISSKLDVLRPKYHAVLSERRTTAMRVLKEEARKSILAELRQEAHKTAGTAGSFGYWQLTESATRLCAELDKVLVDEQSSEALIPLCVDYLRSIDQALDA